MKLNYVTLSDNTMPAYRYRMYIPGEYLGDYAITDSPVDADIHIYSKPYHQNEMLLSQHLQLAAGRTIVLDICDDIFTRKGPVPSYMRQLASMAEAVVVPTELMKERVKQETGRDAVIISDPCEFPEKPIKDISEPKVMWFGTFTNLFTLKDVDLEYPLEVVSARRAYKACQEIGAKFTEWSLDNMKDAFERNNIVIIPSVNERRLVKSPNRVFESIRSGLSVVAAPIPSYQQFDITLDWDMNRGIKNIKKTTPELQKYVRDNFDISVIGEQWRTLFDSILGVEQESLKTG